ncbi:hypothetical protein B296_00029554 [Ensete ventricosum]|uniref:Uncharacterized protein n=1 Tax=Ensete ventricosum TaxID=4639 RepID=A0A426YWF6_ENSVE|nr:hypothetical protein B296_00029554 [Ensete ventricosum]
MIEGVIIVKATTGNNTEPLLASRVLYGHNLSHVNDELKSFQSYLRWMFIDQSNARYIMVFWSPLPPPGCLHSHHLPLHTLLHPHPSRL